MSSYNPSGKIQRVPGGTLRHPGACFSCGNSSQEVYAYIADTEWDGAIYLCETCAIEILTVFEALMIPAHEQSFRDEITRLRGKLDVAENENERLKKLNESYRLVFSSTGIAAPGDDRSNSVSDSPASPDRESIVTRVNGIRGDDARDSRSDERVDPGNFDELIRATSGFSAKPNSDRNRPVDESAGDSGESSSGEGRDSSTGARRPERSQLGTI